MKGENTFKNMQKLNIETDTAKFKEEKCITSNKKSLLSLIIKISVLQRQNKSINRG